MIWLEVGQPLTVSLFGADRDRQRSPTAGSAWISAGKKGLIPDCDSIHPAILVSQGLEVMPDGSVQMLHNHEACYRLLRNWLVILKIVDLTNACRDFL